MEAPGIASELLPVVPAGLFVTRISTQDYVLVSSAVPAGLSLEMEFTHALQKPRALLGPESSQDKHFVKDARPGRPSEFGSLRRRVVLLEQMS